MRLNHFRYLIALKACGSFSKASRALFIAQPSLSFAIKELEDELGFELLSRSKKGVVFTPQGELVLTEANNIMEAVNRIKHIECTQNGVLKGDLRIGGIPYFCDSLLLTVLLSMRARYPELVIQLTEDDSDNVQKSVEAGELDAGMILVCYTNEAELQNEMRKIKLVFRELFTDRMCFIAKADHPLFTQKSVKLEAVLQYPFVTHRKSVSSITQSVLQRNGFKQKMSHISGLNNLRNFILQSEATTVFPQLSVDDHFTLNGQLKRIILDDFVWSCKVGWVHQDGALSTAEEVFIQALKDECRQLAQTKNGC